MKHGKGEDMKNFKNRKVKIWVDDREILEVERCNDETTFN
jgi:hypothetical protein